MATMQKAKHKRTKVIPTDEPDRPTSSLSHNSWVEDFDDNPTAKEKLGVENIAYQVTEVEKLPQEHVTYDLKGHGGSMVSVRQAEDGDRMDFTDEELDFKEDIVNSGDTELLGKPASEAGSYARSTSPFDEDSYAGSIQEEGRKKRRRRKERNVVTPVNDDADVSMSVSDETHPEPKKKGPSEAWSMSSMHDISQIPMDAPPARPKSSGMTRAKSPQTRNRSPGVGTHSASASRAQSVISVREADDNQRVDGLNETGESGSKTRATEHKNNGDNRSLVSGTSPLLKPPQLEHEQQAYVPYVYARDCLTKVMDDMKKMKMNHLRIVGQIEDTYKTIEDETQTQFNMFVGGLRVQYKDKVKTFRQVIEIHREDFGSHKTYWEETLKSLNHRNKALMKEKKKLLIINKIEIDRLEKEKEELTQELTQKLDQNQSSFSSRQKGLEEEKKLLEDNLQSELEAEKKLHQEEVEKLRLDLEEARASAAAGSIFTDSNIKEVTINGETQRASSARRTSQTSLRSEGRRGSATGSVRGSLGVAATAAVVSSGISEAERKRLDDRRAQMEKQLIQSQKDLLVLQTKYDFIQAQYATLASLAKEDNDGVISGQVEATQKDQEIMDEESQQLKEEIRQWEVDFKEQMGREPTEDDRSETVRELETQLSEAETKKNELDSKMATLIALKEGKTPDTQPASIPEPVVKTVEIVIPDPSTVAALTASQEQVNGLETRLKEMEISLRDKDKKMKTLEKEKKKVGKKEKHTDRGSGEDDKHLKMILGAVVAQSAIQGSSADDSAAKLENAKAEKEDLVAKRDKAKQDLELWVENYNQEHGSSPEETDSNEEAKALYASLEECNTNCLSNETEITALSILVTGQIPADLQPMKEAQVSVQSTGPASSQQIQDLEDRIQELEEENEQLTERNSEQEETIRELEQTKEQLEERLAEMESGGGAAAAATAAALANLDFDDDDVEGFGAQLAALQKQVDSVERKLQDEKSAHDDTKEELEMIKVECESLRGEKRSLEEEMDGKITTATVAIAAEMKLKEKSLEETKQRLDVLEAEKLQNLPVDTAKEITLLQGLVKKAEKEKEDAQKANIGGTADLDKLKIELKTTNESLAKEREANRAHQDNLKKKMAEKDKQAKDMVSSTEKKYLQREAENKKQIQALEKKNKEILVAGGTGRTAGGAKGATDAKSEKKIKLLTEQAATLKKTIQENQDKIRQLEKDVKEAKSGGTADKQAGKKMEKQLKDLEKKLEMEQKKFEREKKNATELDAELKTTSKELDGAKDEIKKLTNQIDLLGVAAAEALELKEKVTEQTAELKKLQSEMKTLTENYNSERVLRKKYYNMVEDMKGKIRVYCRTRPLSSTEKGRGNFSVVKAPDEYSVEIQSTRGLKEFQFDHIFMPESTQADVFEDTNNLIQSAVDGYNVCIFAYGQTGSGKTFTMIGDREGNFPGIAPRAFEKIFEVIEENKAKFTFRVETYMLELYNDKLIDLYSKTHGESVKLDIKKDKKGLVFVHGAVVQEASNSKELYGLFEQGSASRHVASTKMNAESSRSHLVIGVVIESTNITTGTVTKGKLSLVDLAGSERAAKTDASAQQLKEANSINKSLSALGDVISALSSEQSFIPYRNNKLTMLMQDSLGGNAKTLMFVNISPADYNSEETVISLTYASRVKLITNDASKNADNKEIARLKEIIAKMKTGEVVELEEDAEV
ncbi:myosin-10-like [Patiria miniata]|uniref:Kinesin motor domain-containing protein n=1 Tax=Patiria miniata TaxID=46514 RepID=A0A913Z178_PATMI|nr:myosin-10-like [Patiria miniata]XP_038044757.1 myosin-10-like [Patiria miniata]